MAKFKFSKEADKDIDSIYEYTILNFGHKQAQKYSKNLFTKIESIANKELQGRKANFIKKDLRKLEVGSHLILYKQYGDSLLIVRILHKNMDVQRHL